MPPSLQIKPPVTTEALRALVLARERQYRDVIDRCSSFLTASGHTSCSDLLRAMAATYGFCAEAAPAPPAVADDDVPEQVRDCAALVVEYLEAHPDVDHNTRLLRERVRGYHSNATWYRALELIRQQPQVETFGTTTDRRYRWNSRAA